MRGCRPLTDDEVTLISKSFSGTYGKRNKALFLLGVRTGFRISEMLSLRVGDLHQHGKIVDRVTVQRRHMQTWPGPPLPQWGVKPTHLNLSSGRHLPLTMMPKSLKYKTRI
jgi:Phage integrase family